MHRVATELAQGWHRVDGLAPDWYRVGTRLDRVVTWLKQGWHSIGRGVAQGGHRGWHRIGNTGLIIELERRRSENVA